jgi:glycosyltransferase involved in cell wall biosynthesis
MMTELTILMPCLNEAETLESCIRKARSYLARSGVSGEVLISDNGSTDGSQRLARELGARVVDAPRKGYGAALIAGIEAAEGRYVIMGDSDDSYDFSQLDAFVARLRDGVDLVMGNRFKGGIADGAMPPLHRYLGNPVLSLLGRLFYRTPIGDFHCGLRGFNKQSIQRLGLRSPGMEFASEMVIKASLAELRIEEVPTTLSPDGRSRAPHLRSWPDGWRHLKLLLINAPHWLYYYPSLALMGVGAVLFTILLSGPVSLGGVTFDVAALILASALILVGSQLACFYAIARLFTVSHGILPDSERFRRIASRINVDTMCQIGAVLLAGGAIAAIASISYWARAGWGNLDPSVIARPALFSVISASLGIQVITTGFLWGLMEREPAQENDRPAWETAEALHDQ